MKRPLMYAAGGFVLGEVCLLLPVGLRAGIPAMVLAGVCCLWVRREKSGRSLLWWILPLFVMLGMGCLSADRQEEGQTSRKAAGVEGIHLKLEGAVKDIRESGEKISLELGEVCLYTGDEKIEYPSVLVYVDGASGAADGQGAAGRAGAADGAGAAGAPGASGGDCKLRIGMRVSVWGELEAFQSPGNPGEFDYGAYYHSIGIAGRMYGKGLQIVDERFSPYFDGIYRIKRRAVRILGQLCTPEDQGVFQAVILGDKSGLLDDIRQMYQKNGIAHLLAVSGLHVSMVGLGFYHLLRRKGLGFESAGAAAVAVTVSYGVMTGGSASVVRAVMMVCLQFFADRLGRTYDIQSAAAAAALFLLIRSPSLLFQSGFQLSFGAVFAIGAIGETLVTWMEEAGQKGEAGRQKGEDRQRRKVWQEQETWQERGYRWWCQTMGISLSIQIVTYPMIAYHFFEYPLYGIILNLLVIPLMGYVLGAGAAGIFLGAVAPWLGEVAIGTGHYILAFYQWLCLGFQKLPGSVQIVGRPRPWQIVLYGVMWAAVLGWMKVKREEHGPFSAEPYGCLKRYGSLAAALLVGVVILHPLPETGMSAIFLDVGQGDGICLRTREAVIMVDGGSSDRKNLGKQVLEPFLKSQGIRKVDCAIVSHGDQDHISGLQYLLENDCGIQIGSLVLPILGQGEEPYETLANLAKERGASISWMQAGHCLKTGELKIQCLYAGAESRKSEKNEHSLMLDVSYGNAGILLTGDMSAEGEEEWMEQEEVGRKKEPSGFQILKVAHHGSKYSSSAEFLERIAPKWAVISCGEGNRYGHPSPDTIERLEKQGVQCLVTMEQGAVMVKTDGKKMEVLGFRK